MALTVCRRFLHKVGMLEVRPFTLLTLDVLTYKKRGAGKYHSWSAFVGDVEYRILNEVTSKPKGRTYYDVFVMKGTRAVYVGTSNCMYGLRLQAVEETQVMPIADEVNDPQVQADVIETQMMAIEDIPSAMEDLSKTFSNNADDKIVDKDVRMPTKPAIAPQNVRVKSYKDVDAM